MNDLVAVTGPGLLLPTKCDLVALIFLGRANLGVY